MEGGGKTVMWNSIATTKNRPTFNFQFFTFLLNSNYKMLFIHLFFWG